MNIKYIILLFFLIGFLTLTAFSLVMNIASVGVSASGQGFVDSPASATVNFIPDLINPLRVRYCKVILDWRVSSGDFILRVEVHHADGISSGEVEADPSTSTYRVALNPRPDVRKIDHVRVYLVRRS